MASETDSSQRRRFLTAASCAVAAGGVAGMTAVFVSTLEPSETSKAAAQPVKVDVASLSPGHMTVVQWRGLPVYVLKRTEAQLAGLSVGGENLKNPESIGSDQPSYIHGIDRSLRPDVLVVIGLCTHLNCTPKYRPDTDVAGAFVCPCHGSLFDVSGRVFKGGPAPDNLTVPPYYYESADMLVIGASAGDEDIV